MWWVGEKKDVCLGAETMTDQSGDVASWLSPFIVGLYLTAFDSPLSSEWWI